MGEECRESDSRSEPMGRPLQPILRRNRTGTNSCRRRNDYWHRYRCTRARWYEITLTGVESHAGPTPMDRRKDALLDAARVIKRVNEIGLSHAPLACSTVGMIDAYPNPEMSFLAGHYYSRLPPPR
ncbi:MAG: hypothetical protein Ct9H300mP14_10840 [Gammaproteobacteria bacterium]|nr:MAG: hypothetical protein Ct9H300mP14_10840 [Gammaproteobacteria bacterium]